jgi:two-component system, NarL family, nitrate/nitrite response regulator NarL
MQQANQLHLIVSGVPHGSTCVKEQAGANRVRLLLVLDQALFRASLGLYLAWEAGFELAGECGTADEALKIIHSSAIDVVLLEFAFSGDRAIDQIAAARKAGYQGRFLIMAESVEASNLATALRIGALGMVLNSEPPDRLVQAIRVVAAGGASVDPRIIRLLADQFVGRSRHVDGYQSPSRLENREHEVILGILDGLTSRKIGARMRLSESSIKAILHRLFAKAGVRTRSQLARWALEGAWVNKGG